MSPDEVGRSWVERKVHGPIGYLIADQMTSDIEAVSVDGFAYSDARYNIVTQ
jgi:hypothetical protein